MYHPRLTTTWLHSDCHTHLCARRSRYGQGCHPTGSTPPFTIHHARDSRRTEQALVACFCGFDLGFRHVSVPLVSRCYTIKPEEYHGVHVRSALALVSLFFIDLASYGVLILRDLAQISRLGPLGFPWHSVPAKQGGGMTLLLKAAHWRNWAASRPDASLSCQCLRSQCDCVIQCDGFEHNTGG